jgi:NAD(P)-dependent dehydrogenase (short-subunit alcohol dehydrogenase family)
MDLSGRTILITGAAGRIGSAAARLAVAAGADVVLSDIAGQRLRNLEEDLRSNCGNKIFSVEADITSEDGIDYLLSRSIDCVKIITSAVHSAYPVSVGWGTRFEELKARYIYQDLAMQLGGAILFSQKILGHFQCHGGGDLVHISSIQGIRAPKFDHYQGTEMCSPIEYAATKAGVISITRWLAKYHANQGIRVNCISPGGVVDEQPSVFLERYRQSCTNIGMLSADQVASAIIFLLSPQSVAINGHNLVVDDGWSL